MRCLLFSNSKNPDNDYLAHTLAPVQAALRDAKHAAFLPFAGTSISWDDYFDRVSVAFAPLALHIENVAHAPEAISAIERADVIFVGGGNTFRLLYEARVRGLLPAIDAAVRKRGVLYVGWSAGSNLASPTIRTTNDMPIIDPNGFEALGFVPYQLNPHYTNVVLPNFQGETRDQRLQEFLVLNPEASVVGLPEGDWIEVDGHTNTLRGPHAATLFRANQTTIAVSPGDIFSERK